jgi:hypothetical protein
MPNRCLAKAPTQDKLTIHHLPKAACLNAPNSVLRNSRVRTLSITEEGQATCAEKGFFTCLRVLTTGNMFATIGRFWLAALEVNTNAQFN